MGVVDRGLTLVVQATPTCATCPFFHRAAKPVAGLCLNPAWLGNSSVYPDVDPGGGDTCSRHPEYQCCARNKQTEECSIDTSEAVVAVAENGKTAESVESSLPLQVSRGLVLVAKNPEEMAKAKESQVEFAKAKLAVERAALVELEGKLEKAREMKQRLAGFKSLVVRQQGRVTFYEKLLAIFELGYCVVPNFPVSLLAVRVSDDAPPTKEASFRGGVVDAECDLLPAGEGRFVSGTMRAGRVKRPRKDRTGTIVVKDGAVVMDTVWQALGYQDVAFPEQLAEMKVLGDLDKALKEKVFDEIGILPAPRRRNVDPMLIGSISRNEGTRVHTVSFMISWWVDLTAL